VVDYKLTNNPTRAKATVQVLQALEVTVAQVEGDLLKLVFHLPTHLAAS
jgi:hypothetical protein